MHAKKAAFQKHALWVLFLFCFKPQPPPEKPACLRRPLPNGRAVLLQRRGRPRLPVKQLCRNLRNGDCETRTPFPARDGRRAIGPRRAEGAKGRADALPVRAETAASPRVTFPRGRGSRGGWRRSPKLLLHPHLQSGLKAPADVVAQKSAEPGTEPSSPLRSRLALAKTPVSVRWARS